MGVQTEGKIDEVLVRAHKQSAEPRPHLFLLKCADGHSPKQLYKIGTLSTKSILTCMAVQAITKGVELCFDTQPSLQPYF